MPLALPVTHNVRSLLSRATRHFAEAGIDQPKLDAMLLLAEAMETTRASLYLHYEDELTPEAADRFDAMVARRLTREPLAKILGRREFWSLDFEVDAATLDPRPDSETLIEALTAYFPDRSRPLRLLDLGTGSGCLLLAALSEYPAATGIGVERCPAALSVARANALRLGLSARARVQEGDWWQGLDGERFDAILCNPPYIPLSTPLMPEVARFDPATALYAGADGLADYRRLLPPLAAHLNPGGIAIFEIGTGQAVDVSALAMAAGLATLSERRDLAGIVRALVFSSPHNAKDHYA